MCMLVSFMLASFAYARKVNSILKGDRNMDYDTDPLASSRGIAWGLALGILIWTAIYFALGVLL